MVSVEDNNNKSQQRQQQQQHYHNNHVALSMTDPLTQSDFDHHFQNIRSSNNNNNNNMNELPANETNENNHKSETDSGVGESLTIFSINILAFPPYMQLLICILFMFVFYTLSGIVQEYLFVQYDDFDYGFFLTLIQFLFYSGASFFMLRNQQKNNSPKPFVTEAPKVNIPLTYLMLGTLMMAGVGLGNESMNYLNYPTKILFKSSKLLLAMVIGFFITGKKYNRLDYMASLSLAFGLVTLYTANTSTSVRFELKGVFLILCALASDSVAGNLQEKILQEGDQSPLELVFYSHAVGSVYLLIVCMITGQLTGAVTFCMRNPFAILLILTYCVLCFVGVQFVHTMTKLYGILATLTAASTRKVLSILLSYIIFPKPFLFAHLLAVVLVFTGVFLRIYNKNKQDFDDLFAHYLLGRKRTRPIKNDSKANDSLII